MKHATLYLTILFTSYCLGMATGSDWPQWRGPDGQGHGTAVDLPLTWSETENIEWKTPLPGRGWSSPVIRGNQIWVTTAHETPAKPEEVERRLEKNTGSQPVTVLAEVRLHAICIDKQSGRIVHDIELLRKQEPQWVHNLNSYASPTPVIDGDRLYCHFGAFGTACVDTRSGKVLWANQKLEVMHENGPGSTPVLWKNRLIVHYDGSDEQFVAAYDTKTGKVAWKTGRSGEMNANPQLKKSYGTPIIMEIRGDTQVVSPGSDWLYGYDPHTGKEQWKMAYGTLGFSQVPRPVTGHGMIYMSTSFMQPQILAIRHDSAAGPEITWRYKRGVPAMTSPILVGNELYFVSDSSGILTCLDARTGKEHYRERLGGNFSAAPVCTDGKIYFQNREGTTFVVQPGTEFKVLSRNTLDGRQMASLAAVDNALYLRTDKALYRLQKK